MHSHSGLTAADIRDTIRRQKTTLAGNRIFQNGKL